MNLRPVMRLCFAAGLVMGLPGLACADRVTIRPEESGGLMTLTGTIADFTDEALTLHPAGRTGAETIPARSVLAIETYRTPGHQTGIESYQRGDIPAAVQAFEQALQSENRSWVRQEILAWLVRCHRRRGDRDAAVSRFVEIVTTEPRTRHWGVAPLGWTAEPLSPRLQVAAKQWLVAKPEAVRLVGASLLMSETTHRIGAISEFNRLVKSADPYVSSQAQALLWSANLPATITSAEQMNRWLREIERMPESIRGGPWYVLAQARLQRNEPDEAVTALLRVFLQYPENEELAARSGLEAALALQRLNRFGEAEPILREVVDRFPWTTSGREALDRLNSSAPPASSPAK